MPAQQRSDAGECVYAARDNRHWTQQQLADAVGCSQAVVSRLESGGQVSLSMLERLADVLELKHADLILDPEPRPVDAMDDLRTMLKRIAHAIFQRAYAERMSEVLAGITAPPLASPLGGAEIHHDGVDQFGSLEGVAELIEAVLPQMPKSNDPL